jgi:hypothetical protein
MIVIAVIAVIASIMIPSILTAVRAANERSAHASLKQISCSELAFRMTDADGNGLNDFWTGDVANLHFCSPVSPATEASAGKFIELPLAQADGSPLESYFFQGGFANFALPKAGYWLFALDAFSEDGITIQYGISNPDRFGFVAVPDSYGSSGRLAFIVNQTGILYKCDPGSGTEYYEQKPSKGKGKGKGQGKGKANGKLKPKFGTYPPSFMMKGGFGAWSKMD